MTAHELTAIVKPAVAGQYLDQSENSDPTGEKS